ncbi:hypothetical protein ACLMJK_007044 [Lecanora helva]
MQLTLNVLIFALGFFIAGIIRFKTKETHAALDDLVKKLRYVTNAFVSKGPTKLEPSNEKSREVPISEGDLLTIAQCEELPPESWQRRAYDSVKAILLAQNTDKKKFPCIYATAGYNQNSHRYTFMHSNDPTEPRNIHLLASALRAYLPLSHSLGPNTSLIIIHPNTSSKSSPPAPSDLSVSDYQQKFWSLLRSLRTADTQPWPRDIPTTTSAAKWAFCFDGVPWFPAAMTPAHSQRQSRHAPFFTVAMQPKWVFDNLFKTPEKRRAAVDAVRKLMPAYDKVAPSPDLSAYGTEGTTEAHQYFLLDENETAWCPYRDLDGC